MVANRPPERDKVDFEKESVGVFNHDHRVRHADGNRMHLNVIAEHFNSMPN